MKAETRKLMLSKRRAASVKAAVSRKRIAHAAEDLGPNSPLRGSAPVNGNIGDILARLRAHGVKAEPLPLSEDLLRARALERSK